MKAIRKHINERANIYPEKRLTDSLETRRKPISQMETFVRWN